MTTPATKIHKRHGVTVQTIKDAGYTGIMLFTPEATVTLSRNEKGKVRTYTDFTYTDFKSNATVTKTQEYFSSRDSTLVSVNIQLENGSSGTVYYWLKGEVTQ